MVADGPVPPGFQVYDAAPVALNTAFEPAHIAVGARTDRSGNGFTVTEPIAGFGEIQPAVLVPVTLYCVDVTGFTLIVPPVIE